MQARTRSRLSLPFAFYLLLALGACGDDGGGGGPAPTGSGGTGNGATGAGAGSSTGGSGGSSVSGSGMIGDPCVADDDCVDPPDAECFTEVAGIVFPGGYCSKGCSSEDDSPCGESGGCATTSLSGGMGSAQLSICVSACAVQEECRVDEGYACTLLLPGFGTCGPS